MAWFRSGDIKEEDEAATEGARDGAAAEMKVYMSVVASRSFADHGG